MVLFLQKILLVMRNDFSDRFKFLNIQKRFMITNIRVRDDLERIVNLAKQLESTLERKDVPVKRIDEFLLVLQKNLRETLTLIKDDNKYSNFVLRLQDFDNKISAVVNSNKQFQKGNDASILNKTLIKELLTEISFLKDSDDNIKEIFYIVRVYDVYEKLLSFCKIGFFGKNFDEKSFLEYYKKNYSLFNGVPNNVDSKTTYLYSLIVTIKRFNFITNKFDFEVDVLNEIEKTLRSNDEFFSKMKRVKDLTYSNYKSELKDIGIKKSDLKEIFGKFSIPPKLSTGFIGVLIGVCFMSVSDASALQIHDFKKGQEKKVVSVLNKVGKVTQKTSNVDNIKHTVDNRTYYDVNGDGTWDAAVVQGKGKKFMLVNDTLNSNGYNSLKPIIKGKTKEDRSDPYNQTIDGSKKLANASIDATQSGLSKLKKMINKKD